MKKYTLDELKEVFEVSKKFTTKDLCYESTYFRIRKVVSKVGGYKLEEPGNWNSPFCRIWGTLIRKDNKWEKFNEIYRARGAPGALQMRGWSHILREEQIWKGELKPGAVLQGWITPQDFCNARDMKIREKEKDIKTRGHSFVFLGYWYEKNIIIGMHTVDQLGFHTWKKKRYSIWFAANFPLFLGVDIGLTITR